jgi:hypothetical protein
MCDATRTPTITERSLPGNARLQAQGASMSCKRTVLALALANVALVGNARAAPISYTEPPDLSTNSNFPTPVGTLAVGVNTIAGRIGAIFDGDLFGVTLPAELRLTSITLNVSNYTSLNAGADATDIGPFPTHFDKGIGNGLLNLFSGAADGPGDLVYGIFSFRLGDSSPNSISFDYVWSITVAAIPAAPAPEPGTARAPGTLMLVGAGLAGFLLTRRRKEPARRSAGAAPCAPAEV